MASTCVAPTLPEPGAAPPADPATTPVEQELAKEELELQLAKVEVPVVEVTVVESVPVVEVTVVESVPVVEVAVVELEQPRVEMEVACQ